MKQAWEDLGTEYEASASVLIGDVDCTVHSGVCSKHGVQGYPTIKYYKASLIYMRSALSLRRTKHSLCPFASHLCASCKLAIVKT